MLSIDAKKVYHPTEPHNIKQAKLKHYDLHDSTKSIPQLEQEARHRQEITLAATLTNELNINMETWADHKDNEDRRLDHDIYSDWKRPYPEVIRFIEVMSQVQESGAGIHLLNELVKNWTTADNFSHVACLLKFSRSYVNKLIKEFKTNGKVEPTKTSEKFTLNKSAEWYPKALAAMAVDDIVTLVMIRKLALEEKMPSLRDLFVGFQEYLARETLAIVDSNDDEEAKKSQLARLSAEKESFFAELRSMAKK